MLPNLSRGEGRVPTEGLEARHLGGPYRTYNTSYGSTVELSRARIRLERHLMYVSISRLHHGLPATDLAHGMLRILEAMTSVRACGTFRAGGIVMVLSSRSTICLCKYAYAGFCTGVSVYNLGLERTVNGQGGIYDKEDMCHYPLDMCRLRPASAFSLPRNRHSVPPQQSPSGLMQNKMCLPGPQARTRGVA